MFCKKKKNLALRQLTLLEAVDLSQGGVQLTSLGKKMAAFPLDPRYQIDRFADRYID